MLHVYGIKNCSTVKKALDWLTNHDLDYVFHDYKKEPAEIKKLIEWQSLVPWEVILNKKGTSWRKISKEEQSKINNVAAANEALLANNSLIKRPIIEFNKQILVGFNEEEYLQLLK